MLRDPLLVPKHIIIRARHFEGMSKPRFEEDYAALERIASGRMDDEAIAALKRALAGKTSLLVSRAADIAADRGLRDLIPDMIAAFDRFLPDGARTDRQCAAKTSIANALNSLEHMGDAVFLAGARCVQLEPSFGKPVDTAVRLRCACAYGLARIAHPDAHYILADLLVDDESLVRAAAAKALAYTGTPEAEIALRLKALVGDEEPDVMSECFTGLLAMAPDRSLDFVARSLGPDNPALMERAALAIGASRLPEAYGLLRKRWDEDLSPTVRRALLVPIALVRSDEAFDFLLQLVRSAERKMAQEAVSALGIYADNESQRKIREAVESRADGMREGDG